MEQFFLPLRSRQVLIHPQRSNLQTPDPLRLIVYPLDCLRIHSLSSGVCLGIGDQNAQFDSAYHTPVTAAPFNVLNQSLTPLGGGIWSTLLHIGPNSLMCG